MRMCVKASSLKGRHKIQNKEVNGNGDLLFVDMELLELLFV